MSGSSPTLTHKNLLNARKLLFEVTALLDKKCIPYHLEGGTLLGIVRDRELLPWDHDVDLSSPKPYAEKILALRFQLLLKGYKVSVRKSKHDVGPFKKGDYSLIKIKPLIGYYIKWFIPNYQSFVVLDLFIKAQDATHTYWQAQEKVMRVENKYYKSFETIDYQGKPLKAPNHYKDFLTEKYGNWSIPVKEWNCGENELTIYK